MTSALSRLHLERCSGVVTLRGESGVLLVGLCKGSVVSVCGPAGPADLGSLLDALDSPAVTFEFCSEDSDDDPADGTELGVLLMHHARRRDASL